MIIPSVYTHPEVHIIMIIPNPKTKTEEFTAAYEFISTIGEGKKIRFSKSKNKYEICAENFDRSNLGYCLSFVFSKKTVQWIGESGSRTWNGENGEKTVSHISNIKSMAEAVGKEINQETGEIFLNFERQRYKNPIGAIRNLHKGIMEISERIQKIMGIQKAAKIGEKNLIKTYKGRKEENELVEGFQKIETLVDSISLKKEDVEGLKNKLIESLIKQEITRIWKSSQTYFECPQTDEKEKVILEIGELQKIVLELIKSPNAQSYIEKLNFNLKKISETKTYESKIAVKKELEKCFLENTPPLRSGYSLGEYFQQDNSFSQNRISLTKKENQHTAIKRIYIKKRKVRQNNDKKQ